MGNSSLTWDVVESCYDEEYNDVQKAAMEATPTHDYVPWCLVDGVVIEHQDALQKYICDAYQGTKPESCKSMLKNGDEVCFNTNNKK